MNMNLGLESLVSNILVETTGAPSSTGEAPDYVVDMSGYDSCMFVGVLDTVASTTGVVRLYPMHSNSSSTTDMVSCTGAAYIASQTTSLDQTAIMLDVQKPQKRYLSAYLYKDVACRCNIIAIRYNARKSPVTIGTAAPHATVRATAVSPST